MANIFLIQQARNKIKGPLSAEIPRLSNTAVREGPPNVPQDWGEVSGILFCPSVDAPRKLFYLLKRSDKEYRCLVVPDHFQHV